MSVHETMFEVLNESGSTIGNVDLQSMQKEIDNYHRVLDQMKQDMQQLRSQVQKCQTQVKMIELRASRRWQRLPGLR